MGFYGEGDEPSGSITITVFLDQLNEYHLL
jgi:hypothetical protein